MESVDIVVRSDGPWLTLDTGRPLPRVGEDLGALGERQGGAAAIREGRIVAFGDVKTILEAFEPGSTLDLGHDLVMPGFVDPHTHPVFNATREHEFEMRNQGRSYVEIAKEGGGIRSSVRSLRESSEDNLVEKLEQRADRFLAMGTTTVEAKSGYGLSLEDELKSLRAIRRVNERHALDLVPTFLGAHEIPDEYRDNREDYIRHILEDMIPAVAGEGLAEYCDVFCEEHVFTAQESRAILDAAAAAGMKLRIHADEIESTGGAELAADVHATTADHLVAISDQGIGRLGEEGVIAVLLPGTSFYLNLPHHAPARRMIDGGVPVAIATDFNPGSCCTQSMPMIMTLACLQYGLTAAEAIVASTINGACAVGLGEDRGIIAKGYAADLVALAVPNARYLPYHFGDNHVTAVVKAGHVVVEKGVSG